MVFAKVDSTKIVLKMVFTQMTFTKMVFAKVVITDDLYNSGFSKAAVKKMSSNFQ